MTKMLYIYFLIGTIMGAKTIYYADEKNIGPGYLIAVTIGIFTWPLALMIAIVKQKKA